MELSEYELSFRCSKARLAKAEELFQYYDNIVTELYWKILILIGFVIALFWSGGLVSILFALFFGFVGVQKIIELVSVNPGFIKARDDLQAARIDFAKY